MGGRNKKAARELRKRQRLLSIASDSSEDSVDNCIYDKKYIRGNPCPKYCKPKTKNHALFLSSIMSPNSQVVVCHGSAGTGKTLMACQRVYALYDMIRFYYILDQLYVPMKTLDFYQVI